jgi:hypothetical protein
MTIGIATANMFSKAKFYALSAGEILFSIKLCNFQENTKIENKYLANRNSLFLHFTGSPLIL